MSGRTWRVIALSLVGIALVLAWGILVLPLLSITEPAPGRELAAFLVVVMPPGVASILFFVAGFLAARGRLVSTGAKRVAHVIAAGVLVLLGSGAMAYAIVLAWSV